MLSSPCFNGSVTPGGHLMTNRVTIDWLLLRNEYRAIGSSLSGNEAQLFRKIDIGKETQRCQIRLFPHLTVSENNLKWEGKTAGSDILRGTDKASDEEMDGHTSS